MTFMSKSSIPLSDTQRIVAVVNRLGLIKAAVELGIPQSTLCVFLKRQRYVRKAQYVQEALTPQTT